jgi:hypothetical protein
MQARLRTLKRLVDLYGVVEEMHSTELQRMTASVREAENAIAIQQQVVRSARFEGRDALGKDDRMGWTAAETQRASAGWRWQRLEQLRAEREVLNDALRKQYVASRLKKEQMKSVTDGMVARARTEEGRRSQAALDDIYLARRLREEMRTRARARR